MYHRKILNISSSALLSIVSISFIIVSLIQSVAIYSFFRDFWGWHLIPSLLASGFVGYIPLLGSFCGYLAMHNIWGYSIFTSVLISGLPLWLVLVIFILSLITNFISQKSPNLIKIFSILLMGLGIIFGTFIAKFIFHSVKKNKEQQNIQKIMKDAKEESEFIKLILQLHPEVERELIAIYQEESPHKIQRIINKYLTEHILKASNELVYERMYEEMQIMKLLQEKNSTLCVAFAVGKFNEQIKNINIKKMNEINIKILQNSKINSNIFQPDESFGEKLINQLKKQKYNLNHLQDLSLQNIDDDKKCRYMIEFSNAILSLKIEDAVYVYKNMLYITYTKGE